VDSLNGNSARFFDWARISFFGQVPQGLSGWLKKFAPAWQQVGRVCFHLAENKNDGSWYELIQ
jgi:non-specific serine/threonine protein kinase